MERDKHVRALLREFLDPAVYTLDFFDDGVSALTAVRTKPPDLVILEILVPKLDGLGLCRAIKSSTRQPTTPVLVLSILSASDRAKLAGADAFMLKPIERSRLLGTVEKLLASPGEPS
ncbi:MAG TPA: response regulator [Nannocystis sp.]